MSTHASISGMSLVEVAVASTLLTTVLGVASQGLISGTRMSEEIRVSAALSDDGNRVLQRIAGQLRSADYNWIYLNEGEVSTYTFRVCTGLGTDAAGEIGPVFGQAYTVAFDGEKGVLSATLVDVASGRVLNQELASGLRTGDGFRVTQLGTDVLVKGNQLQLSLARVGSLTDGTEIEREAVTTVFLRSTIYANTNLTSTSVAGPVLGGTTGTTGTATGGAGTAGETGGTASAPIRPTVILGADTDTSVNRRTSANNLLIKGSVTLPAGSNAAIDWNTFDLRCSKEVDGISCSAELVRGWIASENRNGKLASNEFLIQGWVIGSLVITAEVATTSGHEGAATQTY